jgi:beta-glucanase (GH16 family)
MDKEFRKDYFLLWHDEFDGDKLDSTKWNITHGDFRVNNEDQRYTNGLNLEIKNSCLVITARKEKCEGFEYTSGRVNTRKKADFTYGRIEICAKLPKGRGTWPALWMLGSTNIYGGWPKCGEIDIMEHVGYNENVINTWFHTGSKNHTINTQRGTRVFLDSACTTFNVYAIEWFEDQIDVFINNVLIYSLKKEPTDTPMEWPFDAPHHIILNLAIGGFWGGSRGIDDSIFPCSLEVDYVRVYDMTRDVNGNKIELVRRINHDKGRGGL